MRRYRIFLLAIGLLLLFDQLTKWYIDTSFALGEARAVIRHFFHITYVRNPGAAFGILADHAVRLPFFISVSLLAVAGILWYVRRVPAHPPWQHLALGLILGGALGNLIDRVRLGEVIDFLDVHWYNYHWPAFNIADSGICVGVGILLLCSWQEERRKKHEQPSA